MRFLITLVTASLALTGAANAQPAPRQQQTSRQQPAPKPAPQVQPRQQAQSHTPPKAWKGTRISYQSHVQRCSKKYRSYNSRTDRYTVRGNQTAICRL